MMRCSGPRSGRRSIACLRKAGLMRCGHFIQVSASIPFGTTSETRGPGTHFDVNPNSGEPEGAWQQPRIARNRVFVEAARPSHLLLPVIPRNGTNGMERERSSP